MVSPWQGNILDHRQIIKKPASIGEDKSDPQTLSQELCFIQLVNIPAEKAEVSLTGADQSAVVARRSLLPEPARPPMTQ